MTTTRQMRRALAEATAAVALMEARIREMKAAVLSLGGRD